MEVGAWHQLVRCSHSVQAVHSSGMSQSACAHGLIPGSIRLVLLADICCPPRSHGDVPFQHPSNQVMPSSSGASGAPGASPDHVINEADGLGSAGAQGAGRDGVHAHAVPASAVTGGKMRAAR